MLADAVARKKIGNGDFITVTIKPDPNLIKMAMSNVVKFDDMEEELEKILKRVGELEIVVALGIVKEHVVLSQLVAGLSTFKQWAQQVAACLI